MNTKIDLDSSEYCNLRREILRKVGFVKPLNQASENEADIIYVSPQSNKAQYERDTTSLARNQDINKTPPYCLLLRP